MKFLDYLADERNEKKLLVLMVLLISNLALIAVLMHKCGSFGGATSIQEDIERIIRNNKAVGVKTTVVDWSAFARAAETYRITKIYLIGSSASCSVKGCNTGTILFTNVEGSQGVVEETWMYGDKLIEFARKYSIEIHDEGELTYKSRVLFCEA